MSNETTNDEIRITIFGKEMDRDALNVLTTVIGNSLNVIAEHGAKEEWSEDRIKAATQAAAVGIAWGFNSLIDGTREHPVSQESYGAAP